MTMRLSHPAGWRAVLAASTALLLALAGCSTVAPRQQSAEVSCTAWFEQLDAITQEAHVQDGAAHRLPGYRFLRADRFTASFDSEALALPGAFGAWLGRLAALDAQARTIELANLPAHFLAPLSGSENPIDKPQVARRTQRCADELRQGLLAAPPGMRRELLTRAAVPDDYSTVRRVLGAYELTRIPFFAGVQGWQNETAVRFAERKATPAAPAGTQRYTPAGEPLPAAQTGALFMQLERDALGVPLPSPEQAAALLRAHAPDLHIETRGTYDRFGALAWRGNVPGVLPPLAANDAPVVDTARPVMYQRIAYTRHGPHVLLQLVYSFWFPERPPQGPADLLSGALDAVVLRITLGPSGVPWVADSIHACGCYHLFFPSAAARLRTPPAEKNVEWAFVPAELPVLAPGQRLVLHVASGSHYVEGIGVASETSDRATTPYSALADDALRALPVIGSAPAATRSAFWPNGIVPGTERGERIAFWPMGIESPGAMRQWGRQPTAFVGRRHFDDARLLEQRFELVP